MMLKITISLILNIVLCVSVLNAQEIIPFKLNNHYNIIVKALINNKDSANLMFQIAMHEASLSPVRINKVNSVQFDTTEFAEGLSKVNRIQVANTTIDSIWIWNNEYSGYESDGKIGIQLMKSKIFKINYDQSQFELFDKLPTTSDFISIPLSIKRGQLFISIKAILGNQSIPSDFLLQSGFSGALLYSNNFADQHDLENTLKVLNKTTMSNSAGQKINNLISLMPKIEIDQFMFEDVPVNIFTGEIKNQANSYIGADLIHRFNWIIDMKSGIAYIQKNKNFNDPYYFKKPN